VRILGKDSYWWKKEEKEWAAQDKSGNWWIYKKNQEPTVKTYDKKRNGQTSNKFSTEQYVIVALASALGISLALNVIALIS